MSDGQKIILGLLFWFVIMPGMTVLAVHYGSPQAVWFWCSMLGWCSP